MVSRRDEQQRRGVRPGPEKGEQAAAEAEVEASRQRLLENQAQVQG
jgi:hypothetical protein